MKKYLICLLIVVVCTGQYGCKKFLEVTPIDKLSGITFWQSQSDVDAFATDIYAQFRNKLTSTEFMPAIGELRAGYVLPATVANNNSAGEKNLRLVYNAFAANNLRASNGGVLDPTQAWSGIGLSNITKWYEFYSVIQDANIMYDRVNKGVPGVTAADRKRYMAEAIFLRCFTYFYMVRIYGDVTYYTQPYQQDPLPRMNFVTVLNKCIAELAPVKNDLPVAYPDPALLAIRATRGAADDLLMNMNMWNAGFDQANQATYYQNTADLGAEIIASNTYQLLPLENFDQVMRGKSTEGIFEFAQNVNYEGAPNVRAFFGEMMLRSPNSNNTSSNAYFLATYLQRLYPTGIADKRFDLWFDNTWLSQNGSFQLLKFKGSIIPATGVPEWGFIMFRYAEAILLRAEALAGLGNDAEAAKMLNMIRSRAGAPAYAGPGGQDLQDAIFNERCKELMGEGYLYFDLIRTRRILNSQWTPNYLTQDQFDKGGWTWPIDVSALYNNPYMSLNTYWQ
ncbi:MAG: RagB/SusD family nutrient uptake outer membrane protein [Mucilaginibacter sp.]|uniref:RagB/SusD family nutrient uptake outer membrane protein n=1 Tax=Mucilaginibacter sp. TaxID=1882438 RepID=UPI0032653635